MIKTKNEIYSICKNIPLILPFNFACKLDPQIITQKDYQLCVKRKLIEKMPNDQVLKYLSNTNALCMELTHNCNLRCKYCTYSGIYKSLRTHQSLKMSYTVAKKAIDIFFNLVTSQHRTSLKGPLISFYGGEAIKRMVIEWRNEILKRKCWKCNSWYFCPMCIASNRKGNRFSITVEDCSRYKKHIKKRINHYLEHKEILDEISNRPNNTIIDFLDSL